MEVTCLLPDNEYKHRHDATMHIPKISMIRISRNIPPHAKPFKIWSFYFKWMLLILRRKEVPANISRRSRLIAATLIWKKVITISQLVNDNVFKGWRTNAQLINSSKTSKFKPFQWLSGLWNPFAKRLVSMILKIFHW